MGRGLDEPMDAEQAHAVAAAERTQIARAANRYFLVTCVIGALGLLVASSALIACLMENFNPLLLIVAIVAALGGGAITLARFSNSYGDDADATADHG